MPAELGEIPPAAGGKEVVIYMYIHAYIYIHIPAAQKIRILHIYIHLLSLERLATSSGWKGGSHIYVHIYIYTYIYTCCSEGIYSIHIITHAEFGQGCNR